MTEQSVDPRIITPEEAQVMWGSDFHDDPVVLQSLGFLLHTVATEPERVRTAIIKVLRENNWRNPQFGQVADAIENGADW